MVLNYKHLEKTLPALNCLIRFFFGVIFLVVTPPFQVSDEPNHFFRAYQASEGEFLLQKMGDVTGGLVPKSLLRTADSMSGDVAFNPGVKQNVQHVFNAFSSFFIPGGDAFHSCGPVLSDGFVLYDFI